MSGPDQAQCREMRATLLQFADKQMLLILWAAMRGTTRFEEFQQQTGAARNVLSNRLVRLIDAGVLEKRPYPRGGGRLEYRLTERGERLGPVIAAVEKWAREYPRT